MDLERYICTHITDENLHQGYTENYKSTERQKTYQKNGQEIQTGTSQEYSQMANKQMKMCVTLYKELSEKCKVHPQWDTTTHLPE